MERIEMATVAESLPLEGNIEEKIARFDFHQILQDILLLVSFTLLVVT